MTTTAPEPDGHDQDSEPPTPDGSEPDTGDTDEPGSHPDPDPGGAGPTQ